LSEIMPGALDRQWRGHGVTSLRRRFTNTVSYSRERAEALLRDDMNTFPVIYILSEDIETLGLVPALPVRALQSMYLLTKKSGDTKRSALYSQALDGDTDPGRECLVWMIKTGAEWDGPSTKLDEYDAAIDTAVAYLADTYDEPEALRIAAELMFRRNRRGLNIHDLAWGFYRTAEPDALTYIAKHLISDNEIDVELTCKLMGFDDPGTKSGRAQLLEEYLGWLSEHRPYLYATAESFNSTSKPYSIRHDREAKFLRREIEPRTRSPKKPLTTSELQVLYAHRSAQQADSVKPGEALEPAETAIETMKMNTAAEIIEEATKDNSIGKEISHDNN